MDVITASKAKRSPVKSAIKRDIPRLKNDRVKHFPTLTYKGTPKAAKESIFECT